MRRSRLLLAGLTAALVASTTLVIGTGAGAAAPTKKVCHGNVEPDVVAANSQDHVFTFTLTNQAQGGPDQTLGSANLAAPPVIDLDSTIAPGLPFAQINQATNTLELRELDIPPGDSRAFTFTADIGSDSGTVDWDLACKQSNEFNGTGNDFIVNEDSSLTTTVTEPEQPPTFGTNEGERQTTGTCQDTQNQDCTISSGADTDPVNHTQATVRFLADFAGEGTPEAFRFTFNLEVGNFCVFVLECTGFAIDLGVLPPDYAAGGIAVALEFDQTIAGSGLPGTVWIDKRPEGGQVLPVAPCVDNTVSPCFEGEETQPDGDVVVRVRLGSSDPLLGYITL